MADCKKCRFRSICKKRPKMEGTTIAECDLFRDDIERTEPMTNADRIRAMSDEELAASVYVPCPYDDGGYGECKYGWHKRAQTCEECKLEWLKQPAEVE